MYRNVETKMQRDRRYAQMKWYRQNKRQMFLDHVANMRQTNKPRTIDLH